MLIDIFLNIQPGGSRPHFPMVGLKKIPHAVDFSGLVAARIVSETSVGLAFFRYIWRVRWQRRPR